MEYPPNHEHDLAGARERLDDPTVAAAWGEGEATTLERAVADVLRD